MIRNLIDELNSTGREPVIALAYRVIDTVQDSRPAEQVNSMALLFLLVCAHYGVNVRNELDRADHIIEELRKTNDSTFRALEGYIRGELK